MQKILFFFTFVFLALAINCGGEIVSSSNTETNLIFINNQNNQKECEDWTRIYSVLDEKQKEILKKEGVYHDNRDNQYEDAYYVLSPELVNDCDLRVEIGRLIWIVILGKNTKEDKQFALKNSNEIAKVLKYIWNSPEFSKDGVSEEKYLLLTFEGIKDEDISSFIEELLKNGDLIGVNFALINRQLPELIPTISDSLKKAEREKNLDKQLFLLIVFQQLSSKQNYLKKIIDIQHQKHFSDKQKLAIDEIIKKFNSDMKINYEDIEKLDLQLL